MKTLPSLLVLSSLVLCCGCGDVQSGELDNNTAARISQRASIPYKQQIADWSEWNPWERFTADQRRELDPLQMDLLDLAHSSMQDTQQFTRKLDNPLAVKALKEKTYAAQEKKLQALLKQIHQQGLDNWPMVLEEQGLAFAPGLISWPTGNNTFETAEGRMLTLPLDVGAAQSLDDLLAKQLTGSLNLEQMNESSNNSIVNSKLGDTLYVTLPPGTFEIRQMPSFAAGSNYFGNLVMAVYRHGEREGEIDLCYTAWLLVVKQPEYLRVTTRQEQGLRERMIKSRSEDQQQVEAKNRQQVQQALNVVADTLVRGFSKQLKDYENSPIGRSSHVRNHAHRLRQLLDGKATYGVDTSEVKSELQLLKQHNVPLTRLYEDPRIAHITAPSYVFEEWSQSLKEPEAAYAKMMAPFASKYDQITYDLIRCNLHTGKFVVRESDLQTIQNYVTTGYRPRRPYEQGYVPTREQIALYERLLDTLRKQDQAGKVIVFDEQGESVEWK